jgi:CheY-like chemotaxis protein
MLQAPVLLVDDDTRARARLRKLLERPGQSVAEAADAEEAVAILRTREPGTVVVFSLALYNFVMDGNDGLALLRAVANDQALAARHAFVLLTPTPTSVRVTLGHLLDRLRISIVAADSDADILRAAAADAAGRMLVLV